MCRDISSSVWLNRSLSEGFGQLRSLLTLDLTNCFELEALPAGIPRAYILLPLHFCMTCVRSDRGISSSVVLNCSLSEGFGDLTNLKELTMYQCPAADSMPAALKEQLKAQGCSSQGW
jgi:hypothetical protein